MHDAHSEPGPCRLKQVVVSAEQIRQRVDELARQIAESYGDRELVVLAVMTGSLIFLADLIRRLPMTVRLCLISCKSYPGAATSSQGIQSIERLPDSLTGRDVLVVDDILDSGQTIKAVLNGLTELRPRSVKTCVLLKKSREGSDGRVTADFLGFEIGDEFVVGYGLDYDNFYRNLPEIRVITIADSGLEGP